MVKKILEKETFGYIGHLRYSNRSFKIDYQETQKLKTQRRNFILSMSRRILPTRKRSQQSIQKSC